MISFNPSTYSTYEASDLGNIRFYIGTDTGTQIRSWCESGCTSSSSNAVIWLKLPNGIGANTNLVVNMTFQATSVDYDGAYAGEAPQITTPFGKYDNGGQVFNIYTNTNLFASSTPPSGWAVTSTCDGGASYYCVYYNTPQTPPLVIESYARYAVGSSGVYVDLPIFETSSASVYGGVSNDGGNSEFYLAHTGNDGVANLAGYAATNNIYTYTAISSSSEYAQFNYGTPVTDSYSGLTGTLYPGIFGQLNYAATVWFRQRAYPPSGTMPTQSFGPVQLQGGSTTTSSTTSVSTTSVSTSSTTTTSTSTTSSSTSTVTTTVFPLTVPTKPTVSALAVDKGQLVTFQTYVTNGLPAYSYNFIVSNAGTGAMVLSSNPQSSNSFSYTTSATGTFVANVFVTDNEVSPVTKNSVYSSTFAVNPIPTATSLTPSNSVIIPGQGVTFNVLISLGTGPFTLKLTTNGVAVSTVSGASDGIIIFNTVYPGFNPTIYNVIGTDTGTTPQFTFTSTTNSITVTGGSTSTTSTSTSTTSTSTLSTTSTVAPTTTISQPPPQQTGNGPGSGSGPSGPGSGGGTQLPEVTYLGSCFTISNMTQDKAANGTLNGTFVNIRVNFVGPDTAGITVSGNTSYTLFPFAPQSLFNQSGYSYTAELTNITYVPIQHTIAVSVCSTSAASLNSSTTPILIVNNSGTVTSTPMVADMGATNIGFWPGKVSVSVPQETTNSVYLNLRNVVVIPTPPPDYTRAVTFNLSISSTSNVTILVTLAYNCSIEPSRITPFILNGSTWRVATPFTTRPDLCTVSFPVPSDPIVGLMIMNQTAVQTTNVTVSKSWRAPIGGIYQYLIAGAVAAIVIVALLYEIYRIRRGKPTISVPNQGPGAPVQPDQGAG
jgi:hypothetical protein